MNAPLLDREGDTRGPIYEFVLHSIKTGPPVNDIIRHSCLYCSVLVRSGGEGGGDCQFHSDLYVTVKCGVSIRREPPCFEISAASRMPLVRSVRSTGQEGLPVCIMRSTPSTRYAKCMKGRASWV